MIQTLQILSDVNKGLIHQQNDSQYLCQTAVFKRVAKGKVANTNCPDLALQRVKRNFNDCNHLMKFAGF